MYSEPLFEDPCSRTRERLGREYHTSERTVNKYGAYSTAMDLLRNIHSL